MKDTLPDKTSELLKLALKDLLSVESDKDYSVNMYLWHESVRGDSCHVCLAGSVMARTLKVPKTQNVSLVLKEMYLPGRAPKAVFRTETEEKLRTISNVALGSTGVIYRMLRRLALKARNKDGSENLAALTKLNALVTAEQDLVAAFKPYGEDREAFIKYLKLVIRLFRKYEPKDKPVAKKRAKKLKP